jgi:hypothetical protein
MASRAKNAELKKARRKAGRRFRPLKWIAVAGVIGLVIYGVSQMSSIAYSDRDLTVVDFSALSRTEKNNALEAANLARCTCGCGMTLAQCVATDSTCPVRDGNIDRIKRMVEEAKETRPAS